MRTIAFVTLTLALGLLPSSVLAQAGVKKPLPDPKTDPKSDSKSYLSLVGGRTLDEWIADIPSKDRARGEAAVKAVMMFGPELAQKGVKAMLKELDSHFTKPNLDTSMRSTLTIALGEILSIEDHADAKQVLEGVKLFSRLLEDSQANMRYRAAQALGKIGKPAAQWPQVLPKLMLLSREKHTHENRNAAVFALGRVGYRKGGPDLVVLGAIYDRLRKDVPAPEESSVVRLTAIQSLTYLGPPPLEKDQKALEKVLEDVAAQDSEMTIRIWAHMGIMSIQGKADPMRVNIIGKMIAAREPHVRSQAIQALMLLKLDAKSQVPALHVALEDEDRSVAIMAMIALGQLGRWAEPAIPRLTDIATNNEVPEGVRRLAQQCIDNIKGKTDNGKGKSKTVEK